MIKLKAIWQLKLFIIGSECLEVDCWYWTTWIIAIKQSIHFGLSLYNQYARMQGACLNKGSSMATKKQTTLGKYFSSNAVGLTNGDVFIVDTKCQSGLQCVL